jgi:hypothetical protein
MATHTYIREKVFQRAHCQVQFMGSHAVVQKQHLNRRVPLGERRAGRVLLAPDRH